MQARVVTPCHCSQAFYSKGVPSKYVKAKKLFAYPRTPLKVHEERYDDAEQNIKGYTKLFLQFKSYGQNGQNNNAVTAEYFKSDLPGPRKLVVILPLWGGSTYPSDAFSLGIVKASVGRVDVIKLLGPEPLVDMEGFKDARTEKEVRHLVKTLARNTRSEIINVQRLINWTLRHENIARKSVYIMGFSKGTIAGAIVAQIDPQVTHAILVIGGASAASLVYACDYYNTYKTVPKNLNWSKEKYIALLKKYLWPYDVYNFPTRLKPSHVLIFDSKYDNCFWSGNREAQWLAMGKPKRISLLYGHQIAFSAMTLAGAFYMRHKVYEFIKKGHT